MTEVEKHERTQPEPAASSDEERSSDTPQYEPPEVITYHREDLLEELGPALACSFSGAVVSC